MFDPDAPFTAAVSPLAHEAPRVQAFVARHRPFFILVGILVAQLLLLSLQITRNRNVRLIRIWAVTLFDPLERSVHGMASGATRAWRTYRGLWGAQQQNHELSLELVEARARIQELSEQAGEAQRLRSLLDFKSHMPLSTVAAEVIGSSPGESSSAIFIDKGSAAGLAPDLAVITPEGVVGKIIAVFGHTSQVLLITDPSSGLGALLEGTRTQGILKGSDGNVAKLHYVMNEVSVSVGETVLSSGMDRICPKGLPLGTVSRVEPGNIYKNIQVEPAAPLNRLESVLVVVKLTPPPQLSPHSPANH